MRYEIKIISFLMEPCLDQLFVFAFLFIFASPSLFCPFHDLPFQLFHPVNLKIDLIHSKIHFHYYQNHHLTLQNYLKIRYRSLNHQIMILSYNYHLHLAQVVLIHYQLHPRPSKLYHRQTF